MSAAGNKLLKDALQHHQAGRMADAANGYSRVLAAEPDNPDALYLFGVLKLQSGDTGAAIELLNRAIERNPGQPDYYNMCGEAHRMRAEFTEAIRRYEEAIAARPDFAGALLNLGNALQQAGRLSEAASQYERALQLEPGLAMAHNNLGLVRKAQGRPDEAAACFRHALGLAHDYAEAHTNLGNLLRERGAPAEALGHHERAIALAPDFAEAHCNLGRTLTDLGHRERALESFRRAADISPGLAIAHNNMGIVLDDLRRPEDAIACYEKALAIDPDYADAHNNLANALDELGRHDDAAEHYRRAIAIEPRFAEARRHLARLRPSEDQLAEIESLLSDPGIADTEAMHLHFALGEIHVAGGRHERAFEQFSKANALAKSGGEHDPDRVSGRVDAVIAAFTAEGLSRFSGCGSESELPVFVVGMPRSGTTLVEQIIASHPRAAGAGELDNIEQIERSLLGASPALQSAGGGLSAITPSALGRLADDYLAELRAVSGDALRVVDKAVDNFLRVGLIRLLFPRARIVHCRRNALDTCVSAFFTHFVSGQEFSRDLDHLARYYVDYARVMSHWDALFPGEMLHIDYEELVSDQESASRRLIGHLGLDWDPACLAFHRTERAVRTASSAQVRRPIYAESVNRWRHYAEQLAPLAETLRRSGIPIGDNGSSAR